MTERGIYPEKLAASYKDRAGQKYRPSNGSEGEIFMQKHCDVCQKDRAYREDPDNGESCHIVVYAFAVDTDDEKYPAEWTYTAEGQPTCTAFEPEMETPQADPAPPRCDKTLDMFEAKP